MSRLTIKTTDQAQEVVDQLYLEMERRLQASPPGLCPVDLTLNFLNLCHAQTCGKCVPCRIGLGQLAKLLTDLLDGRGTPEHMKLIEDTAAAIEATASCAIGRHAATLVLNSIRGSADDYWAHIHHHRCLGGPDAPVPCVAKCPAGVDVPGYIALIRAGRNADAVRLIRKDNPFPVACAYICEHPCEARCRRTMIDSPMNIRGLKRYAVDNAGQVPQPACAAPTGKRVAVIGGGPGGLSAAYYLALMGHEVTVYEKRHQLGGMLRYGIPSYRFPRKLLDDEISSILSLGVKAVLDTDVGKDIGFDTLRKQYDSVFISIGAHTDKKAGIPGEDSNGVYSAVEMLRAIGDDHMPDFHGKKVVVIGGGNVAMDVNRSSVRLGAEKVSCVYRRRQEDMTALPEEVEGAIAEGVELLTLMAPTRIEADAQGNVTALWVQRQMSGPVKWGRPAPVATSQSEVRIPADIIIVAVGQGIESRDFENAGIAVRRGAISAFNDGAVKGQEMAGVFAGGDCVSGPASAIRAIAAGKVAAANIDEYLGYQHEIRVDVEIPAPILNSLTPRGRINTIEREAAVRKNDFVDVECGMTEEEAMAECSRCLRCDRFGYGILKGGREEKW